MSKKISIAIDAMGGDNSPDKTIKGIKIFLDKNKDKKDFVLNIFGHKDIIIKKINKFNINDNLYVSVKEKLENDYKYTLIEKNIDPLKYGPQYGYSSGRLSFKKFDL